MLEILIQHHKGKFQAQVSSKGIAGEGNIYNTIESIARWYHSHVSRGTWDKEGYDTIVHLDYAQNNKFWKIYKELEGEE